MTILSRSPPDKTSSGFGHRVSRLNCQRAKATAREQKFDALEFTNQEKREK
jgi:hypothetical protein